MKQVALVINKILSCTTVSNIDNKCNDSKCFSSAFECTK